MRPLLLVFCLLLVYNAVLFSQDAPKITYGPQVVMRVYEVPGSGNRIVVPQGTVFIELLPVEGPTVRAPLNMGDYLVCRDFQIIDDREVHHLGYRCGPDTYVMKGLGIVPDKHR